MNLKDAGIDIGLAIAGLFGAILMSSKQAGQNIGRTVASFFACKRARTSLSSREHDEASSSWLLCKRKGACNENVLRGTWVDADVCRLRNYGNREQRWRDHHRPFVSDRVAKG